MKKFIAAFLAILLIFGVSSAVYIHALHDFPEGLVYNYLEQKTATVQNLQDYVAAQTLDAILVYEKATGKTYTLGDSAFDLTKSILCLIFADGNTLYYYATDPDTHVITYYAFDLASYEKTKVAADTAVTNKAGFLGMDSLLGLSLSASSLMSIMMNMGKYWINHSGVHDAGERKDYLSAFDKADEYGLYDNMDKIAETDALIFFLNYFGELVCFDKQTKSFTFLSDCLVSDFFITADTLYYFTEESEPVLVRADYDGGNAKRIGTIQPSTVKFADDRIFISDEENMIYLLKDGLLTPFKQSPSDAWAADENAVYTFDDGKFYLTE